MKKILFFTSCFLVLSFLSNENGLAILKPSPSTKPSLSSLNILVKDAGKLISEEGTCIALDSSGNIFVGGYQSSDSSYTNDFIIMKFKSTGRLDRTFGSNGIVVKDGGATNSDVAQSMVLDSSGNIFIGGYGYGPSSSEPDFMLMKFDSTGNLDSSFGSNGIVTQDGGETNNDYSYSIGLDSSGNIFMAGAGYGASSSGKDFLLMKFDSTGNLDSSFGSNGIVAQDGGATKGDSSYSIALDSSGNIFMGGAGYGPSSSEPDFMLMKFDSTGNLDSSFGSNGIVAQDGGETNNDYSYSIGLDSSGNIIAGGVIYRPSSSQFDFMLMKFDSVGDLDPTFGLNGIMAQDGGGATESDYSYSIALDSSGNIFMAGAGYGPSSSSLDFMLMKFDSTGNLDTTFGSSGIVVRDAGGSEHDSADSIALDSSGNIFLGGGGQGPSANGYDDFVVMKYQSNGKPASF